MCLLSWPVQAWAAPRPENSNSDEKDTLFGLDTQITIYDGERQQVENIFFNYERGCFKVIRRECEHTNAHYQYYVDSWCVFTCKYLFYQRHSASISEISLTLQSPLFSFTMVPNLLYSLHLLSSVK
jgi:hypothetical protein